jgi:hypothetical protein
MKLRLILLLVVIMYLFSCTKEQDTDNYPFENVNYLNELVSIDNDITKALGIFTGEDFEACGVTDTAYNELDNIYAIYFSGNSCNNKIYRNGRIDVQLLNGSSWYETNAQIKVTVVNLELRDINTGIAVVVSGSRTYTNLTGDLDILDLVEGTNEMLRKVESTDLTISYGDGSTRVWNESYTIRTRKGNFEYYFEIIGDDNAVPYAGATSWGINRAGSVFYTVPSTPIKATLCFSGAAWVTTGGEVLIHTENKPTTQVIHGLDNQGNVSTDACFANTMKIIWTDDSGEVHQALKQYY